LLRAGPGLHHERAVDRQARDLDALLAEPVEGLDEAGQVLLGAGGRERAGHGEQHHLPAVEQRVRVDGLDAVANPLERDLRNPVAWLDAHRGFPRGWGNVPLKTAGAAPSWAAGGAGAA